jgi:hypothetical protein
MNAPSFAGILDEADSLSAVGDVKSCEQALTLLENECNRSPGSFEVHWRAARACRDYAAAIRYTGGKNWEKNSSRFGKKGMAYAEKAMARAPEKVEGYFYFAINVGIYADGVSVLTALKEGLKGKTQTSLEKAYAINRSYRDGGPAFALGRFWAVVPWPYQDKKKAMKYYREYQTLNKNDSYWQERTLNLAEFLVNAGKDYHAEARALLQKVTTGKNSYLAAQATGLIDKIDGKK